MDRERTGYDIVKVCQEMTDLYRGVQIVNIRVISGS